MFATLNHSLWGMPGTPETIFPEATFSATPAFGPTIE